MAPQGNKECDVVPAKHGGWGTGKKKKGDIPFLKIQMRHVCKRGTKKDRKRRESQRHRKRSVNTCGRYEVLLRFWCFACNPPLRHGMFYHL